MLKKDVFFAINSARRVPGVVKGVKLARKTYKLDTEPLACELQKLLELGATEKVSRNRCFDKFSTPFGRRLFAYYRTCMALKKEIEDPKRKHRIRVSRSRGKNFTLEIVNEPIAYRRTATLPVEVRPFFEKVIKEAKAS